MKPTHPIYEYIKMNTKEGRLPENFRIPWIESMWAPGAHDGVFLKHVVPVEIMPDANRDQRILDALQLMSADGNGDHVEEIFTIFEELEEKATIVRLYDEIQKSIYNNQDKLNGMTLLNFGDWLICQGVSLLAVKWGLTVISAFKAPFVEEVMMEFGVYDEFTYYAARELSRELWKNGNEELFRLAQNVQGWGRIHAVDYLRAESQEISDWLLYHGAENTIFPQYSADVCLQKTEAEKRLEKPLSAGEFEAIGKLIQHTLGSGPCPGLTDGERILPKYLSKAKEFPIDQTLIRKIVEKAGDYSLSPDTVEEAKLLLER